MNTENMDRMIDNWLNGNRITARTQAKRTTAEKIAEHLKGADNYQAACDATAAECHTNSF